MPTQQRASYFTRINLFPFSDPMEEDKASSLSVSLLDFKEDLQDMMPSEEDLQRILAVLKGFADPETEEEREFALKDGGNQEAKMYDKLLDARYISGAYDIQKCVGRIITESGGTGTGFRISKSLVMTAAHVLKSANRGHIQFHYYEPHLPSTPGDTVPLAAKSVDLDPDSLYYANDALDFAIIAISGRQGDLSSVGIVSYVYEAKSSTGYHTNIFSHPLGNTMKVSLRQNIAVQKPNKPVMLDIDKSLIDPKAFFSKSNVIIHEADTEPGSSGSPIFNDKWQLMAIHQGCTRDEREGEIFVGNYGCLIKYILEDMYSKPQQGLTVFEQLLKGQVQRLGIPFEQSKYSANFRKQFK